MTTAAPRIPPDSDTVGLGEWLTAAVFAMVLTGTTWQGLLSGGGLVGGDTYTYFLPQKQMMAECLAAGELPLWHDRTALGYPLLAESQAGVFYPSNQILYRLFDADRAYSSSIVLHYLAAYVLTWRFLRSQRLSHPASLFSAAVFVYGWFPVRLSLEWSIIGGAWFPCALWLTHRLITAPTRGRFAGLAVCLAVHLLAGHFALAFITHLTCVGYALLAPAVLNTKPNRYGRWKSAGIVAAAIGTGLLLSSVQLLPTLELKAISQRSHAGTAFDPAYGHLPPVYLTQLVASWWYWHTPEIIASGQMMSVLPWSHVGAATNPVEAHFYVGMVPLLLIAALLLPSVRTRVRGPWHTWTLVGLAGVIYATGWPVALTRHLPGFGWFMGPGRYTIVAQLAAAVLAGMVFDDLFRRRGFPIRLLTATGLLLITVPDLLRSSQFPVSDAVVVSHPPYRALPDSWVRATLAEADPATVRLLIRGPNTGNLYGVSCLPSYLGLGPGVYVDEQQSYRAFPEDPAQQFPAAEAEEFLRKRGVTHILTTEPLDNPAESVQLVHSGPDAYLNSVWARGADACWLYRFTDPPQRVYADPPQAMSTWKLLRHRPTFVEFSVTLNHPAIVGLRELTMPGWIARIDQVEVEAAATGPQGIDRRVTVPAGEHVVSWTYAPPAFRNGAVCSLLTLATLILIVAVPRRRSPSATGTSS